MARSSFFHVAACCLLVACAGLASARPVELFNAKSTQSTRGRHLLAHIEQEELRHLGRGLRADGDTYTYGEFEGYKTWGGICQQGSEIPQSPVNIPATKIKEAIATPTEDMHFHYANFSDATAVNTGHGVQVNMGEGNYLEIGDQKWALLQYHFHSPSENALANRLASMEIHLVHSNVDTGDLAVVGILMSAVESMGAGNFNSALDQGLAMAPKTIKEESKPFTLKVDTFTSLLRPSGALPKGALVGSGSVSAITFTGSLTTPPCTAGVQWYVFMKASPVGASQVLSYQRFLGNGTTLSQNRRPVQPSLNRDYSAEIMAKEGAAPSAGEAMAPEATTPAAMTPEVTTPEVMTPAAGGADAAAVTPVAAAMAPMA